MGTRADAPIEQKGHDYNVGGTGSERLQRNSAVGTDVNQDLWDETARVMFSFSPFK